MKVINIFGGPGAGKSTHASGLFYLMKSSGKTVELITEYAKQMIWDERERMFKNQLYLFAKQNHKQDMLKDKVDYCITDCPLLMNLVYTPNDYYPSFTRLVWEVWNSYENVNFYLHRGHKPYIEVGRYQTKEEAEKIDDKIESMLALNQVDYHSFNSFDENEEAHIMIMQSLADNHHFEPKKTPPSSVGLKSLP